MSDQDRWDAGERDYKAERDLPLTPALERAAEVRRLALEVAAAMAAFPKLNAKAQTSLAIAGDVLLERLHNAWYDFANAQWKERA